MISTQKVLVIDAGLGNIGSVVSSLKRHDCSIDRRRLPPKLEESDKFTHLILPGVGAFATGMRNLRALGWDDWISSFWVESERPLLGICLGMQLLATTGTEGVPNGKEKGLNLIPGHVKPLITGPKYPLPHVGWNEIVWKDPSSKLAQNLPLNGDMYFVHSYCFNVEDESNTLATTEYDTRFVSAVHAKLCFGVQFHPEKSQYLGRTLIKNFLSLTNA